MPSRKKRDKARKTAEGEVRRIRESKPIVLHTNKGTTAPYNHVIVGENVAELTKEMFDENRSVQKHIREELAKEIKDGSLEQIIYGDGQASVGLFQQQQATWGVQHNPAASAAESVFDKISDLEQANELKEEIIAAKNVRISKLEKEVERLRALLPPAVIKPKKRTKDAGNTEAEQGNTGDGE